MPPVSPQPRWSWIELPAAAYLASAGLVVAWLIWGAVAATWACRHAADAPEPFREELARIVGDGRVPRLLVSSRVTTAVALGLRRPTIVLPAGLLAEGPPQALCAVLTHEWAHIRNGDLWLLAMGRCLLVLLFAHPLFWWLRRAIRGDQELLADAAAAGDNRPAYAEELLRLARKTVGRSPIAASAAVGIWESSSQLSRRIAMLLDENFQVEPSAPRRWRYRALGLLAILGAACSLVTLQPGRSSGEPPPDSGAPDFVRPILEAKTVKYKSTVEMKGPPAVTITSEEMVLDATRSRSETHAPSELVRITDFGQGKSLSLYPEAKHAMVLKLTDMTRNARNDPSSWLRLLQLAQDNKNTKLQRESLGEREIDGRRAVGFRVRNNGRAFDLWGDPKTGVPLRVEMTMGIDGGMKVTLSDFVVNEKMDESLFSVEPPAGYRVDIQAADASPVEEKDLVGMFREYSRWLGVFPDSFDPMKTSEFFWKKAQMQMQWDDTIPVELTGNDELRRKYEELMHKIPDAIPNDEQIRKITTETMKLCCEVMWESTAPEKVKANEELRRRFEELMLKTAEGKPDEEQQRVFVEEVRKIGGDEMWKALKAYNEKQNAAKAKRQRTAEAKEAGNRKFMEARQQIQRGFEFADQLPPGADMRYAGKGVAPGAADTPIFWYRRTDANKYRVIYADLSVRDGNEPPKARDAESPPHQSSAAPDPEIMLPVYYGLRDAELRKELGIDLTAEQWKGLSQIAADCKPKMSAPIAAADWKQLVTDARKQVEAVLTPQQLLAYKKGMLPLQALERYEPEVWKTLGITPEQEEKMAECSAGLGDRGTQAMERSVVGPLAALSPQQRDKLRSEIEEKYRKLDEDDFLARSSIGAEGSAEVTIGGTITAMTISGGTVEAAVGPTLPVYPRLQDKDTAIARKLGVSAEQRKQFASVAAEYESEMGKLIEETKRLSPDQRKQPEARAKAARLHDEARRRIEALLTPQQLADLKEADFRRDASIYLVDPEVQKKIGLDDKQKAGVFKARWDASSEIRASRERTIAKCSPFSRRNSRRSCARRWSGRDGKGGKG